MTLVRGPPITPFTEAALEPLGTKGHAMTTAAAVALNIATALKESGVDVVKTDLGRLGLRVDVRGKASAAMAAELLSKAGLCEVRALHEGRGLWLVVGRLAA